MPTGATVINNNGIGASNQIAEHSEKHSLMYDVDCKINKP